MSKRALKAYLGELTKKQLQEQVLDLYTRFKPVKTYYNFVFNPKEEKYLESKLNFFATKIPSGQT